MVAKQVQPCNYLNIHQLPCVHLDSKLFAEKMCRFLFDPEMYPTLPDVPLHDLPPTGLSANDERVLADRFTLLEAVGMPPKCTAFGFKVPELHKKRCRAVWACHLNDILPAPPSYNTRTPSEVWEIMAKTDRFVQFDIKAYYDQFKLDNAVKPFFAFRTREGKPACLANLPTGVSFACATAQAVSWVLTDFDMAYQRDEGTYVTPIVHIDNFGFAFKKGASTSQEEFDKFTCRVIGTFLDRVTFLNIQLNEISQEDAKSFSSLPFEAQLNDVLKRAETHFVFLGTEYDLKERRRTNTQKTLEKLEAVKRLCFTDEKLNPGTTPRQLAVLMGIAKWASQVLNIRHVFFDLHQSISLLARFLFITPSLWDAPLGDHATLFNDSHAFIEMILQKKATPLMDRSLKPESTLILLTDASAKGWGAIAMMMDGGEIHSYAGEWDETQHLSSVVAEPKAVQLTLEKVLLDFPSLTHIVVGSDHEGLILASRSSQARAFDYFKLLANLPPHIATYFSFVPGIWNPADSLSRKTVNKFSEAYTRTLATATGAGVEWALQTPPFAPQLGPSLRSVPAWMV